MDSAHNQDGLAFPELDGAIKENQLEMHKRKCGIEMAFAASACGQRDVGESGAGLREIS
jgi:hypothetical protein